MARVYKTVTIDENGVEVIEPLGEIQQRVGRSPASGRIRGRHLLANGQLELTDQQIAFAEWLANPDTKKGTQVAFAASIGVHPVTLQKWKKDDAFVREWERQLRARNITPDRVQRMIDALYVAGTAGDVKAALAWLQVVDKFTPKTKVEVERTVADMADDELEAELEASLLRLRQQRR